MLSMRAAWAASTGRARASTPTAKAIAITRNHAKLGAGLGFLSITLPYQRPPLSSTISITCVLTPVMCVPSSKKYGRAIVP